MVETHSGGGGEAFLVLLSSSSRVVVVGGGAPKRLSVCPSKSCVTASADVSFRSVN